MANERAVPIPHRALKREHQLITTTPSLDVDKLIAFQATERDRSSPPPATSATRERDDRDRRAAALKLLPHSLPSRQLATPRTQPGRMRLGSLTTRRRAAPAARQRLATRARALSPTPRNVHPLPWTSGLPRRIPAFPAARARRRPAVWAPLIQPCPTVAHGRSRAFAPRRWSPSWSPFWSPFFWRELTFDASRWRTSPRARPTKVLLLTRSDSVRLTGATGLEPATSSVTERRSFAIPDLSSGCARARGPEGR
jgi:hypothetical protein